MSDDFEKILASLDAGKNPTSSTNGEVTILSMFNPSSEKRETEFGIRTIMEYVQDSNIKKINDIDADDIIPETSEK